MSKLVVHGTICGRHVGAGTLRRVVRESDESELKRSPGERQMQCAYYFDFRSLQPDGGASPVLTTAWSRGGGSSSHRFVGHSCPGNFTRIRVSF